MDCEMFGVELKLNQNEICRFAFIKLVEAVVVEEGGLLRLMLESLPPNLRAEFSMLCDLKFSRSAIESLFFDVLRLSDELLSLEEFKLLSERLSEDEHDCERSINELLLRLS